MKWKTTKIHVKEDGNNLVKRRVINVLKWVLYAALLCFSYAFMMTPKLFEIENIKPLLVLPLIISVTVFEGELAGGIYAIFAGLLWSSGVTSVFWGFHPIILYICAVLCGVFVHLYFQENLISTLFLGSIAILIYMLVDFFVNYFIWNYPNNTETFLTLYVPTFIYTILILPIYYFMIRGIHTFTSRRNNNMWMV